MFLTIRPAHADHGAGGTGAGKERLIDVDFKAVGGYLEYWWIFGAHVGIYSAGEHLGKVGNLGTRWEFEAQVGF